MYFTSQGFATGFQYSYFSEIIHGHLFTFFRSLIYMLNKNAAEKLCRLISGTETEMGDGGILKYDCTSTMSFVLALKEKTSQTD